MRLPHVLPLLPLLLVVACRSPEEATADDHTLVETAGADGGAGGVLPGDGGAAPGCATFAPFQGSMHGGPLCKIATAIRATGNLEMDEAVSGFALVSDETLFLRCDGPEGTLMSVRIDCYQGTGQYTVPAGALTLSGAVSDRPCRIGAFVSEGTVRGFISCDGEPAPSRSAPVFAFTGPPIGLGSFALPLPR